MTIGVASWPRGSWVSKYQARPSSFDVARVDLREPAVALLGVAAAVGQPALRLVLRRAQPRVVDVLDAGRGGAGRAGGPEHASSSEASAMANAGRDMQAPPEGGACYREAGSFTRPTNHTPTMKLTLVVPLPPMFSVWTFRAPST